MAGLNDILPTGAPRAKPPTLPGQGGIRTSGQVDKPEAGGATAPGEATQGTPLLDKQTEHTPGSDHQNAMAGYTNRQVLGNIRDMNSAVRRERGEAGAGRGFVNPAPALTEQPPVYTPPAGIRTAAPVAAPVVAPAGPAPDQPGFMPDPTPQPTATNTEVLTAARGADVYGPGAHNPDGTGGMTGFNDTGPFGANSAHNQNFAADVARGAADQAIRLGGRHGVEQANVINTGLRDRTGNASAERIAGIRETGETQRAIAANKTTVAVHAGDNAASIAGHRMANDVARAQMVRDQDNKDRSYQLDVVRFGQDVAEKNLAATASAQKANQEHLQNMFRTTNAKGEDVPDHPKIASYNAAVEATLPQFITQLKAAGSLQALKAAHDLETRGSAALTPQDHDDMTQMFNTREQLRTSRSRLPGGAELSDSNNLLNFRQAPGAAGIQKNVLTPNRVQFAGGSSATPHDLSIRGGANAILPDFFTPKNDDLLRGIRKE